MPRSGVSLRLLHNEGVISVSHGIEDHSCELINCHTISVPNAGFLVWEFKLEEEVVDRNCFMFHCIRVLTSFLREGKESPSFEMKSFLIKITRL